MAFISPPINRASLAPSIARTSRAPADWRLGARRLLLLLLVLPPSLTMTWFFVGALPQPRGDLLDLTLAAVFGLLFAWVAVWFWTAVAGFLTLLLTNREKSHDRTIITAHEKKVAVLMPVYNEQPALVAAAIATLYCGLKERKELDRYDFFILSDSHSANQCLAEENLWIRLVRDLEADGKLFYRRRKTRGKRKSGNVADFCRRWGNLYEYMIVLDADSILSADAALELTASLDRDPKSGIIQSFPKIVNQRTFYGRLQQFSNSLYGRMFAAGLHFWQRGAGMYWGHNAIIRIQPFMKHCMLPRISRGLFSGDILSHDFVEAALMHRAGYKVRIDFTLPGSAEQTPPTFSEDVIRDRRWSRGNLQHLRLLGIRGLAGTHRAMFIAGAFSYISSGVWLLFLALGTAVMVRHLIVPPVYFPTPHSPFPHWPVWHRNIQIALIAGAFGVLLLPKLFAATLALLRERHKYGGAFPLIASVLLELLMSALFAPSRMLLHTGYVLSSIAGSHVEWGGERRRQISSKSNATQFPQHTPGFVLALLWLVMAANLSLTLFLWLIPALLGLLVAPILERVTASETLGNRLRRRRLLLTGEETQSPTFIQAWETMRHKYETQRWPTFEDLFTDRAIFDGHLPFCSHRNVPQGPVHYSRLATAWRLIRYGPDALSPADQMSLLNDREALLMIRTQLGPEPPRE